MNLGQRPGHQRAGGLAAARRAVPASSRTGGASARRAHVSPMRHGPATGRAFLQTVRGDHRSVQQYFVYARFICAHKDACANAGLVRRNRLQALLQQLRSSPAAAEDLRSLPHHRKARGRRHERHLSGQGPPGSVPGQLRNAKTGNLYHARLECSASESHAIFGGTRRDHISGLLYRNRTRYKPAYGS